MNRYKNINTKLNDKNKPVYQTCIYPHIPPSLSDIYITTNAGDRLDLLADKYYQNSEYWVVLAGINKLGKGSMVCEAGIQLRIIKDPEIFIGKIK